MPPNQVSGSISGLIGDHLHGLGTTSVIPLAAVILLVGFIVRSVKQYYRLRDFKGPWLGCFTNLWIVKTTLAGRINEETYRVNSEYGSLARIGPNYLVTNDPTILRRMSAPRSPYTRAIWYEGMRLDPKINNVISERSEKRHNALRAKMAMGYSGKENPLLEKSIDNRIQDMINLIRKKYISEGTQYRPLDFAVIAQYFTMDVLTDVAFGEPFGYLKNDKDMYDYIKTIRGFMPVLELQTNSPLTNYIMSSRVVKALLAPTAKDLTGMGPVIRIAQEVVRERFGPNKIEREDMLGSFVRHGLTQQEAESESLLQIMAGADSTATAIRSTLLYIISHPRVYNKLQAEIDEAERNGAISNPITNNEAKNLPYLQAVIKEGLRIFPPLTGLMTKLVPPEGDTINGQFIPGGTEIGYNAWGTHHRKETFGEDAILFRPERWLEADPDQLRAMENSNELVFGSGRYKCLGHPVAHIELNKTFLQLLRTFDFQLADPIKPFSTRCNGIHIQQFMWVRVSERVKAK